MNTDQWEHSPPTDTDLDAFEPPSRWPLVIGTIATLYACLGLLFMCISIAGVYLGPWLQASIGGMEPVPVPMVVMIRQTVFILAGIALGILLLVGGISTLKRKRRGPWCINCWVVIRLVVLLFGVVFLFMTLDLDLAYQEQVREGVVELMRQNNYSEEQIQMSVPEQTPEELRSTMIIWALAISGMTAVCPIVLGVVMTSKRIRAEWQEWP